MIKMRRKSGLRRAQRMYHGKAVRQKPAMVLGLKRRSASRQRFVNSAQKNTAPPQRIIAAGPLANTASPRKKPKRIAAIQGEKLKELKEVGETAASGSTSRRRMAAKT